MDKVELVTLPEPRLVDSPELNLAGLSVDYTRERMGEIPQQWERFNTELDQSGLPARVASYGVVYPMATMRYITGVEIEPGAKLPEGWISATLPTQRYAVFAATGGIPMIRRVWVTIWTDWLPKSTIKLAQSKPMLEWYPEDWIRSGDFEIRVPIE
jgi:AraC family transcriptional regulator